MLYMGLNLGFTLIQQYLRNSFESTTMRIDSSMEVLDATHQAVSANTWSHTAKQVYS